MLFLESWDGPPLWVPEYRLLQLLVIAIAILCFTMLCILAVRQQLRPLRYLALSILPLLVGLLLSVSLSLKFTPSSTGQTAISGHQSSTE